MKDYLIDSHCHLHDLEYYEGEKDEVLKRAHEFGVKKLITIGTDPEDSLVARDFCMNHDDVYWSYGIHPEYAKKYQEMSLPEKRDKLVAIGEVGLDYHYGLDSRKEQIALLENILQVAQDEKIPVIFHVREAFDDFWPILANFHLAGSVLHSFSDNKKNLKKGLENGCYIGVNGLATFATLPMAPLEKILLETDAPFLTPKPFRGKVNEPGYVKYVADWLAEKTGLSLQEIYDITTKNTEKLFEI